jgi:hypothetical protein
MNRKHRTNLKILEAAAMSFGEKGAFLRTLVGSHISMPPHARH